MANDMVRRDGGLPAATQMNINAAEGGTAVGVNYGGIHLHVDSPELIANLMKMYGIAPPAPEPAPAPPSYAAEWQALRTDAYCLFVLENEEYDCGGFSISKSNALERYTAEEYQVEFKSLSPAARDSLLNLPCIFARRNRSYRHTDKDHPVVVGRLTDIKVGMDTVRFRFNHFCVFSQEDINENTDLFGLASCPLRNELDEEHWSIRSGSLQEMISQIGVDIE